MSQNFNEPPSRKFDGVAPKQKKCLIAIDSWKLPIFKKHLTAAGYQYDEAQGVSPDTLFLTVFALSEWALEPIVRVANNEAARSKLQ